MSKAFVSLTLIVEGTDTPDKLVDTLMEVLDNGLMLDDHTRIVSADVGDWEVMG